MQKSWRANSPSFPCTALTINLWYGHTSRSPFLSFHVAYIFGDFGLLQCNFMKKNMEKMIKKVYIIGIFLLFSQFPSITHGYQKSIQFKLPPVLTVKKYQLQATSNDKTTFFRRQSLLGVLRKLQANGEVNIRNEYDISDVADVILNCQSRSESQKYQSCEMNQIAELCTCLAEAGVSSAELGVDAFKVIDAWVGSISTGIVNKNNTITTPIPGSVGVDATTPTYSSADTGLMELLRGLHGMQVRWRTLSPTTRINLEALVGHTLDVSLHAYHTSSYQSTTTNPSTGDTTGDYINNNSNNENNHHRHRDTMTMTVQSHLAALIITMGHLKVAYADLTPNTRHLLGNNDTHDYSFCIC